MSESAVLPFTAMYACLQENKSHILCNVSAVILYAVFIFLTHSSALGHHPDVQTGASFTNDVGTKLG